MNSFIVNLKSSIHKLYGLIKRLIEIINYKINYQKLNPKLDLDKVNNIILVAHPDDEILFFKSELEKSKDWLVVCMTNGGNKVRSSEFIKSMKDIGAQYKMFNFPDGMNKRWSRKKAYKNIDEVLKYKDHWDKVVTHNEEGEYGHYQHKQLHKIVKETYKEGRLYTTLSKSDMFILCNKLDEDSKNRKVKFICKNYKSQQDTILRNHHNYIEYEGINVYKNKDDI